MPLFLAYYLVITLDKTRENYNTNVMPYPANWQAKQLLWSLHVKHAGAIRPIES